MTAAMKKMNSWGPSRSPCLTPMIESLRLPYHAESTLSRAQVLKR